MEMENICEELDENSFLPIDVLSCNLGQRPRSQEANKIIEMGKTLLLSVEQGDIENVRNLIYNGAPLTTDGIGTSALHFAAMNNHLEIAECLLKSGSSADARTKVDRTPLHMATYYGHFDMVQLLLSYNAEIDSKDMLKMTPLHWAIDKQHIDIVEILLEHGADVHAISKFDKTPISLAYEHSRHDMVLLLQQERITCTTTKQKSGLARDSPKPKKTWNQIDDNSTKLKRKSSSESEENKKQKLFVEKVGMESNGVEEHEFRNSSFLSDMHSQNVTESEMESPLKFLQAHGITLLPTEKESIVENAMDSGQTVILTEAGKLALNLTDTLPENVRKIQMPQRRDNSNFLFNAEHLRDILSSDNNILTGPNILKKHSANSKIRKGSSLTSPSKNSKSVPKFSASEKRDMEKGTKEHSSSLEFDNDIEEITEHDHMKNKRKRKSQQDMAIQVLIKQLEITQGQIDEYHKKLEEKKEEAERYKQQLRILGIQI